MASESAPRGKRRAGRMPSRRALLASIREQEGRVLADQARVANGDAGALDAHAHAMEALSHLYDTYEAGLSRKEIARCPLSGEVVTLALDDRGLDGPYWNHDRPIRPVQKPPATVFAYTGAVDVDAPDGDWPHTVRPGPGRPFLVPRFMAVEGMKAVISALRIGRYDAYAMVYFHRLPLYDVPRIDHWGASYHVAEWREGGSYRLHIPDYAEDFDFEVERYLERGQAYWIAAGDAELKLNGSAADYPFANCTGRDYPAFFAGGRAASTIVEPALGAREGASGGRMPPAHAGPAKPPDDPRRGAGRTAAGRATSSSAVCASCGAEAIRETKFCTRCGAKL